jgi:hypothetical protein
LSDDTSLQLNRLFNGLIWPAIAGNVAWALFTVAISLKNIDFTCPVYANLAALLFVAWYLMYNWAFDEPPPPKESEIKKENFLIGPSNAFLPSR